MRLDVDTVQDVALLRQVIHLQEAEIARLHKRLCALCARLAQAEGKPEGATLQLELLKLTEQLKTLGEELRMTDYGQYLLALAREGLE